MQKIIHIDELPERCHRDIRSFFSSPDRNPDRYTVLAEKCRSDRGYPIWQVFFLHKSDAEILKKENGRRECRIVEGCSDIPT